MSHLPNLSALSFANGVFPEAPNTRDAARRRLLEEAGAPLELLELPDDLLFYIVSFSKGMSCDQIITNCLASKAFAAVCAQDVFWRWQSEKAGYDRQDRLDLINNVRVPKGGSWRRHYQWWCKRKHTDQTIRTALDELRPAQGLGWQYAHAFFGPMSQWDVSDVTDMSRLFERRGDDERLFRGNIAQWDVSNVQTFSYMFAQQTAFNRSLSRWKVSSALNMAGMFMGCSVFDQSLATWAPHVSKVRNMSQMFRMFENFGPINLGLSNWDVSSVEKMDYMFALTEIQDDLSQWAVSKVKSMRYTFFESPFNGDLSNWDVSQVTDMSGMFAESKLNGDLGEWADKLGRAEPVDMKNMFRLNTRFVGTGLEKWDVRNVDFMTDMFKGASSFNADLSSWNTWNTLGMKNMFLNATSYSPPPNFDIGEALDGELGFQPGGPWPDELDADGNVVHTGEEIAFEFGNALYRMDINPQLGAFLVNLSLSNGFKEVLPTSLDGSEWKITLFKFIKYHLAQRAVLEEGGTAPGVSGGRIEDLQKADGRVDVTSPQYHVQFERRMRAVLWLGVFADMNGGNLRDATFDDWRNVS